MNYNKLVRDKIPEQYQKEGKICITEQLELEEYATKLMEVLQEEMQSFREAFDREDDELAVKKIADVEEVLYAVLNLIGVEKNSFEKIRLANKQKYGGYQDRILLKEIVEKDYDSTNIG